jgi:CheY-like chemotaxis protein
MIEKTSKEGTRCVLVLSKNERRAAEIRASLEELGMHVYTAATPGDAFVIIYEKGCDVVVADVGPPGISFADAAGVMAWVRGRFSPDVRGVAVARGEFSLPAAQAVGFEAVLDEHVSPQKIAEIVSRLAAERQ